MRKLGNSARPDCCPALSALALASLVISGWSHAGDERKAETPRPMPFLAIWHQDDGLASRQRGRYVQVAVWSDGTIFFNDATDGKHVRLKKGTLSEERVT